MCEESVVNVLSKVKYSINFVSSDIRSECGGAVRSTDGNACVGD